MTLHRISHRLLLGLIVLSIVFAGVLFAQEPPPSETQEKAAEAAVSEFEGTVSLGLGKYFYLPAATGYDVVVQGMIQGQDASFLTGKEIRIKGIVSEVEPQVLIADSIEVKSSSGQYESVFTRTEEFSVDDYIDSKARNGFLPLTISAYNKAEEWQDKGKVKVHGQLVDNAIVIKDDRGGDIGKILVDNISDFARYYIDKLKLFDKFWFYIDVKDTVDWGVRRRSRELFHADVLFAGLY